VKFKDDDIKTFSEHKKDYVNELVRIGDTFYDSVEILEKNKGDKWYSYIIPAGFLASRCAEYYLKALVLSYKLDEDNYIQVRKCSHNLNKLFNLLLTYDSSARNLKETIEILDKYSGDKVTYPEKIFKDIENDNTKIYGNDFIVIRQVRNYVKNVFEK
jgi:hypothetical protein